MKRDFDLKKIEEEIAQFSSENMQEGLQEKVTIFWEENIVNEEFQEKGIVFSEETACKKLIGLIESKCLPQNIEEMETLYNILIPICKENKFSFIHGVLLIDPSEKNPSLYVLRSFVKLIAGKHAIFSNVFEFLKAKEETEVFFRMMQVFELVTRDYAPEGRDYRDHGFFNLDHVITYHVRIKNLETHEILKYMFENKLFSTNKNLSLLAAKIFFNVSLAIKKETILSLIRPLSKLFLNVSNHDLESASIIFLSMSSFVYQEWESLTKNEKQEILKIFLNVNIVDGGTLVTAKDFVFCINLFIIKFHPEYAVRRNTYIKVIGDFREKKPKKIRESVDFPEKNSDLKVTYSDLFSFVVCEFMRAVFFSEFKRIDPNESLYIFKSFLESTNGVVKEQSLLYLTSFIEKNWKNFSQEQKDIFFIVFIKLIKNLSVQGGYKSPDVPDMIVSTIANICGVECTESIHRIMLDKSYQDVLETFEFSLNEKHKNLFEDYLAAYLNPKKYSSFSHENKQKLLRYNSESFIDTVRKNLLLDESSMKALEELAKTYHALCNHFPKGDGNEQLENLKMYLCEKLETERLKLVRKIEKKSGGTGFFRSTLSIESLEAFMVVNLKESISEYTQKIAGIVDELSQGKYESGEKLEYLKEKVDAIINPNKKQGCFVM